RRLALGGEKGAETLAEIRGAAVEADRHGPVLPAGRVRGQLRGREEASNPGVGGALGMGLAPRPPARRAPNRQTRLPSFPPPPPEKMRFTIPAGGSVSENSTASRLSTAPLPAGLTFRHLQHLTRSKRSAARQRLSSGFVPSAESQSKRSSAITRRFSCGRHMTSATLTSASCRWVDTTSRSSRSRATNFTGSMTRAPCRFQRYGGN